MHRIVGYVELLRDTGDASPPLPQLSHSIILILPLPPPAMLRMRRKPVVPSRPRAKTPLRTKVAWAMRTNLVRGSVEHLPTVLTDSRNGFLPFPPLLEHLELQFLVLAILLLLE